MMAAGTKLPEAAQRCAGQLGHLAGSKHTIAAALQIFLRAPLYVVDSSLQSLFESGKALDSIVAMFEADVAIMPFPAVVIELMAGDRFRNFVHVEQDPDNPRRFIVAKLFYDEGQIWDTWSGAAEIFYRGNSYEVQCQSPEDADAEDMQYNTKMMAVAVSIALLMSHVSGIEREVIEPAPKLNKARVRSGKRPIPKFTVVRIGHVYDRSGKKVPITDANRRTMPVHMRSGHVRRQPFGVGRTERRTIWIAPVLVNYKDGSPLPLPKPKVVRL